MSWQPAPRSRAQIAFAANPISQEVRDMRSKMLADADRTRQLVTAEEQVHLAQAALDRASTLSAEKANLDVARQKLTELSELNEIAIISARTAPAKKAS